eukprot:CAMPEP_0206003730 /NCGR_PEP_ID=MMETSP1464-20131121/3557_1 /ASSEMBLY_ACC=CAM_ASM_001124 /TAXON_ID=119497 /ORGANISM="Exanthemachrysis gayraliae, Strain RCC1523" /LENGTH=90 /DNA_ID=CAMNT_0053377119 /DNA_START=213 /DNA_END=481 /DNA_ORIENTATION=+
MTHSGQRATRLQCGGRARARVRPRGSGPRAWRSAGGGRPAGARRAPGRPSPRRSPPAGGGGPRGLKASAAAPEPPRRGRAPRRLRPGARA